MRTLALSFFALVLSACGGGSSGTQEPTPPLSESQNPSNVGNQPDTNLTVFKWTGAIQCEGDGRTPEQSAAELINAGIDVLDTLCGEQTGIAATAVCGNRTFDLHAHQIRAENFDDAQALGFDDIELLVNEEEDTSYAIGPCEAN